MRDARLQIHKQDRCFPRTTPSLSPTGKETVWFAMRNQMACGVQKNAGATRVEFAREERRDQAAAA
jgi:hypothetical protein